MTLQEDTAERHALLTAAHYSFNKGLTSYAFFKVHNHALSDDLVQDTFIKTWTYLVKKGEIHIMKAFLYHILNNLIVDEYRKRKTSSLDVLLEKGFEPREETTERLFNILDGKAVLLLLPLLPVKYQAIIRMRYVQDLSLAEIGLITRQSKNTVAVQVHRGIERLKVLYHKHPTHS